MSFVAHIAAARSSHQGLFEDDEPVEVEPLESESDFVRLSRQRCLEFCQTSTSSNARSTFLALFSVSESAAYKISARDGQALAAAQCGLDHPSRLVHLAADLTKELAMSNALRSVALFSISKAISTTNSRFIRYTAIISFPSYDSTLLKD